MVDRDSFDAPGDAANASRRPASILLDQRAHIAEYHIDHPPDIADNSNETTATAKSTGGHTMAVTFWVADPPGMSFFSVISSSAPDSMSKCNGFKVLPHVVGAEGRFVLLRAFFFSRYRQDEYFMYKAGDAESPSLERVPLPGDGGLYRVREFGIVPGAHGSHYLLVALVDAPDAPLDYQLHIYSSESKTWSSRTLLNPCPGVKPIKPEKVITLGEGLLGWVDFSYGMLVCNLRQDAPDVCFIPLPAPLPENRNKLSVSGASPRLFRDITCVNGVLKFVEMEHRVIPIPPENYIDPSDKDLLYDSDFIMSLKRKDMDDKPKQRRSRYGWRAMTWSRTVLSNCWRKGCVVDVADIIVDQSTHLLLQSGLRSKPLGEVTFRDLYSAFPTLSTDGDDVLYLKSVVEPSDRNGWVVAVDLGNKTVKALGAHSFSGHDPSEQAFRPCTLSHHLNMTPGIEVSAYPKITLAGSSANDPNNTSIRVDEPISCESRSKLRRLSAEKVNHARNEAQSTVQNDHISRVNNNVESTMKLQRLILSGKFDSARNEAQSIVQNDHIARGPSCSKQSATDTRLQQVGWTLQPWVCTLGPCP